MSSLGEGFNRQPPFSPEAETAVLAAMLISPDAITEARAIVKDKDFFREANRRIFRAIEGLSDIGSAVDVVVLADRLKDTGELEAAGGIGYLADILDGVPTARNVANHAAIVRDKASLRALIESASETVRSAYNGNGRPASEILIEAEESLADIVRGRTGAGGYRKIRDAIYGAMEEIESDAQAKGGLTGLPTGFDSLNRMTGGFKPGGLTVCAGRPGHGKSAWAWQVAVAAAEVAPVGICSLEMSDSELVKRGLSMSGGVNLRAPITDDGYKALSAASSYLDNLPIWIDDRPRGTLHDIRAKFRRLMMAAPIKLFIVDYLQLVEGDGENRTQQVSGISRALKQIARESDIHVLALSQLSRAVESRNPPRPRLSDLRDSGAIEQDADNVVFLWRPELYFDRSTKEATREEWKSRAELIVGKQRSGPLGGVILRFEKETTTFSELSASGRK